MDSKTLKIVSTFLMTSLSGFYIVCVTGIGEEFSRSFGLECSGKEVFKENFKLMETKKKDI